MELKKYKLGDLCTFINGRAYLQPELQNSGKYKIVRVGNLSGGNNSWYYSDMELEPTKYCAKGDLLYAWACNFGPYIWKGDKTIYHYHIWKVINSEQIDKMYLYYLLKFMTNSFMGCVHGSTMLHITKENMESMEVRIHASIEEQRRIATILNKLDCKIELNRQINDNLEAMAKQLYDYWFVQFDFPNEEGKPYKSSGGAMAWNEKLKREIPKEWMASNYTNLFTIGNGQTMPQNEGLVPAYGGNGIVKMVEISNYPACIIIGRVGANCGSIHYSKIPCWVSDNAISICSKNDDWQPFLFYSLKLYNLSKNKGGSSQPLITHEALKHLYFPMSEKHINQFCHIVNELQDLIYSNQQEILKLTKQRDELLPLLMNGQATVNYHLSDD